MPEYFDDLAPVVLEPPSRAESAVIFLHGLDDQGSSWTNLVEQFRNANCLNNTRFILPTAKWSKDHGSRAWYTLPQAPDTLRANPDPESDSIDNYAPSLANVDDLIEQQVAHGIPLNKIVLGGFSQGCAITLLWAITREKKLAGIAAVSGYLPLQRRLSELKKNSASSTRKALVIHGMLDQGVPVRLAQDYVKVLEQDYSFDVDFLEIPEMPHQLTGLGVAVLQAFLSRTLE